MTEEIRISRLCKAFRIEGRAVDVLQNLDLTLDARGFTVLVGRSGCGKTTLLRLLAGLLQPDSGQISLPEGLNMGIMFQEARLMPWLTAERNVTLGIRHPSPEKARDMLRLVGLAGFERAYPAQLSGGMQQRVAIARALTLSPKVLLCDEATSALDPSTTRSILALLRKINKELGVTIVIITHQMSVIEEACNRVAILDKSRIAECGDVEEVFRNPKSDIAKLLILGEGAHRTEFGPEGRCVRIVFDGKSAFEPIIADIVLNCKAAVNILFADTRTIDGVIYGQMLIQLPDDEAAAERILNYLDGAGVYFCEEAKRNA